MNRQETELKLWEYIDGVCDETARAHAEHMIATDARWKQLYDELLTLHTSISLHTELEEPSMRFTKNVMEAVGKVSIAPATGKYINPVVIRTIAGFFVLCMVTFLVYAFSIADWDATDAGIWATVSSTFGSFFNNTAFNILICANVLVGLIFLDTLLRNRNKKMEQLPL